LRILAVREDSGVLRAIVPLRRDTMQQVGMFGSQGRFGGTGLSRPTKPWLWLGRPLGSPARLPRALAEIVRREKLLPQNPVVRMSTTRASGAAASTVSTALLPPNGTVQTSVYAGGPVENGRVLGDLILYGIEHRDTGPNRTVYYEEFRARTTQSRLPSGD
jgi:hypothetical protein